MISEKPKYTVIPGADLNKTFIGNFGWVADGIYEDPGEWTQQEKQALLKHDMRTLSLIFRENNIPFLRNPYDRVRFLEPYPYELALKTFNGPEDRLGFSVPAIRFGFVDIAKAESEDRNNRIPSGTGLRFGFTHELSHCLEFQEQWKEERSKKIKLERRGFMIQTFRDKNTHLAEGGLRLNEGLAEYLGLEVLNSELINIGLPLISLSYPGEVDVIKFLIDKIGLGPVLRACYTRDGLEELSQEMDRVFGEDALKDTLEWMGFEYREVEESNETKNTEEQKMPKYRTTLGRLSEKERETTKPLAECLV
jgi:hypothetical protein